MEQDGEQLTANDVCGSAVTHNPGDPTEKYFDCGRPINGKYISLQTLVAGQEFGFREVSVFIPGLTEGIGDVHGAIGQ